MKMQKELTSSEVVKLMVEYVRKNLVLDNRKEEENKQSLTFTGTGVSEKDEGIKFAFEVVTNIENGNRALSKSYFNKKFNERSSPRLKKDRTFSGILLPRSIDYRSAKTKFQCPYFKQANLLNTVSADKNLQNRFYEFEHYNVKDLSIIERELLVPFYGKVTYFNPSDEVIQVCQFSRFPWYEIIPDNVDLKKDYFWDFVKNLGFVPKEKDDEGKKLHVFRKMQEGLHNRIRKIHASEKVKRNFTLESYETFVNRDEQRNKEYKMSLARVVSFNDNN